jgi:XTP/dITP diphosphohydrolase
LILVLATANRDKAEEIRAVLRDAGVDIELRPRPADVPDVDETGATLEENARLKAVALCAATGLPAVADDTGLEVDALDGAPGVHSARFAGDDATYADNVARLLQELGRVPDAPRTARFTTVALARWPDGHEVAAIGAVEGVIAHVPRGREGFGYDPVFIPAEGDGRTFAEMAPAEKHRVSHRGRAFRTLADGLKIVQAINAERAEPERSGGGVEAEQ